MDESRRCFLKTAGVSIVGIGVGTSAVSALAEALKTGPYPNAKTAHHWAMVIDTRTCANEHGCRECINACHQVHNVPTIDNPRHEIKWIWKETFEHAFPMQYHERQVEALREREMLVLCNHCENPPCVRVCPTQATWKRDSDGIVMMDMHRCIGCRFCVVACPYGSRSFNWLRPEAHIQHLNADYPHRTKGVVEKCNFCAERLAKGLLPACVEACQKKGSNALLFGDLADPESEVARLLDTAYTIRRKPSLGTGPNVFYIV